MSGDTKIQNSDNVLLGPPPKQGLYDPQLEKDTVGVVFVVNMKGRKSHSLVEQALQVLLNLDHRGACGCEANTGDGAGILIQPPHDFLKLAAKEARISLPSPGEYCVAMCLLPPKAGQRSECEKIFREIVVEEVQRLLGWRTIPTNNGSLC